jgi:hypothetical protein
MVVKDYMSTWTMCGGVEESSDDVAVALVVAGSLRQNGFIDIDHDNLRLDTVEQRQLGGSRREEAFS